MAELCKHEQFIIQSDAQKTFEAIMLGGRIVSAPDPDKPDAFLLWVESN